MTSDNKLLNVYSIPAFALIIESFSIPMYKAPLSAIKKPIPLISLAKQYGSLLIIKIASSPYNILMNNEML